jgi:hypothetical protein
VLLRIQKVRISINYDNLTLGEYLGLLPKNMVDGHLRTPIVEGLRGRKMFINAAPAEFLETWKALCAALFVGRQDGDVWPHVKAL